MMDLTESIKEKAIELGFSKVGITDTTPFLEEIHTQYTQWIQKGYNAKMDYLGRNRDRRLNPSMIFEGAKSIVSVAINYNPGRLQKKDKNSAFISRYALGYDYHRVVTDKLETLLGFIEKETKGGVTGRVYCDTAPLLEKAIAERAGLGWLGKNTALITEEFGSWVFLGEVILDTELRKDTPGKNLCSDCNLCINACPTGAITAPGIIDASRCISYLTIENRENIPVELRKILGNRVFGCDICQEVCPFNSNVIKTEEPLLEPQKDLLSISLEKLFILTRENFEEQFKDSAIKRAKQNGLLRNIIVAMGNSGDKKYLPLLRNMLNEENVIIKESAAWAIGKIGDR